MSRLAKYILLALGIWLVLRHLDEDRLLIGGLLLCVALFLKWCQDVDMRLTTLEQRNRSFDDYSELDEDLRNYLIKEDLKAAKGERPLNP
jgi:hypothetical protein